MENGQAEIAEAATPAPMMFMEIEQNENVARGCVEVIEIIAYDVVGKKLNDEKKEVIIEKGRKPVFCQTPEDTQIYEQNCKASRTEKFTVQVARNTAIKYINDPENMKQFGRAV